MLTWKWVYVWIHMIVVYSCMVLLPDHQEMAGYAPACVWQTKHERNAWRENLSSSAIYISCRYVAMNIKKMSFCLGNVCLIINTMHKFVHSCTHMYTHVPPCILMYTHVYTCTLMYTHVHSCIPMYIHVHPCTPMYTHVHPCTLPVHNA